jgi:dipeptidyl aminopeptidase/acylaminoacyl peptidase
MPGELGTQHSPASWSPDGKTILVERSRPTGLQALQRDILALNVGDVAASTPWMATPFDERQPAFSPDGRYVAYVSNEASQAEVFIRPFPEAASARWQVSSNGGQYPKWNSRGTELYYLNPARQLVAVDVSTRGTVAVGKATPLFTAPVAFARATSSILYDVAPDGRFLFSVSLAPLGGNQTVNSAPIIVVLNGIVPRNR